MITSPSSTSTTDETDKSAVNVSDCNTLRRSASKRFKAEVSQTSITFEFSKDTHQNRNSFMKKTIRPTVTIKHEQFHSYFSRLYLYNEKKCKQTFCCI